MDSSSFVGMMVLYILPDGPCKGEPRPAVIVKEECRMTTNHGHKATLHVFTRGTADGARWGAGPIVEHAIENTTREPGTWLFRSD